MNKSSGGLEMNVIGRVPPEHSTSSQTDNSSGKGFVDDAEDLFPDQIYRSNNKLIRCGHRRCEASATDSYCFGLKHTCCTV